MNPKDINHALQKTLDTLRFAQNDDPRLHRRDYLLALVQQHATVLSAGEIGQIMGLTTPRVALLLKDLAARGWVTRTPDSADHRRTLVQLTAAGAAHLAALTAARTQRIARLIDQVGPQDAATFLKVLQVYARSIEKV